jgi:hypothetical protein
MKGRRKEQTFSRSRLYKKIVYCCDVVRAIKFKRRPSGLLFGMNSSSMDPWVNKRTCEKANGQYEKVHSHHSPPTHFVKAPWYCARSKVKAESWPRRAKVFEELIHPIAVSWLAVASPKIVYKDKAVYVSDVSPCTFKTGVQQQKVGP